jgi:hypothetical protein
MLAFIIGKSAGDSTELLRRLCSCRSMPAVTTANDFHSCTHLAKQGSSAAGACSCSRHLSRLCQISHCSVATSSILYGGCQPVPQLQRLSASPASTGSNKRGRHGRQPMQCHRDCQQHCLWGLPASPTAAATQHLCLHQNSWHEHKCQPLQCCPQRRPLRWLPASPLDAACQRPTAVQARVHCTDAGTDAQHILAHPPAPHAESLVTAETQLCH